MKHFLMAGLTMLAITGCSSNDADCSDAFAAEIIGDEVKAMVSSTLAALGSRGIGGPQFSREKIDEQVALFEVSIDGIRTTAKDKDINKNSCSGSLVFSFPEDNLAKAETGTRHPNILNLDMVHTGSKDFGRAAAQAGLEYQRSSIAMPVDYSVQPSDDGEELFVSFTNLKPVAGWISKVASSSLMVDYFGDQQAASQPEIQEQNQTGDGVQQCVDAKIEAFRREMGDEAPINYMVLDEWEGECSN